MLPGYNAGDFVDLFSRDLLSSHHGKDRVHPLLVQCFEVFENVGWANPLELKDGALTPFIYS
ncbi:hypothetical protein GCM10009592_30170 [Brachybacterium rhamnosum]